MGLALIGACTACAILIIDLIGIKRQIKSIKRQLEWRNREQSKGLISLEFQDKALNGMAAALNETLKQEADLRISREINEREFKDLITNISHDLRTPLTVMKGYLQLLKRCGLEGESVQYLELCCRHTDEMERRVRQFFEYSYWTNKEDPIALHTVNITNLVMEAMTDFVPLFEEKGISMRLLEDSAYKGLGDEEALQRVVHNILKNCLQYASGEVAVSIEAQNDKIQVCFTNPVEKNCSPEADKVFQRFYVANAGRNQSGGLGLSIVKMLVEKMQGEVFAGQEGEMFYVGFLIKRQV